MVLDVQAEFDQERDVVVRQLTGMILSWDQNGHLLVRRNDIGVFVAAVDLLKRSQLKHSEE